mmetsp:Transcript_32722/g.77566  ORF Transcript_32722/g.77566 Transcript_32722/m.77566 type:complete len:488 (+) Transcript_32722:114-1577(+)
MSDPLSLLREYIINKQPVSHDEQSIIIGELRFPRSTVTAYKQDRGRGDPYPLEALYFLVQKPHLAGAAKTRPYNDECRKASFSKVLLADQKDVLAYLTGKTETSQYLVSIDELAVLAVPAAPSDAPSARPADADRVGEKRHREEPSLDLTNEDIKAAKLEWAAGMDERALAPTDAGKTPEGRGITDSKEIKATSSLFVRGDTAVTRSLIDRERYLITRQSCLQVHGKDFSAVLALARAAHSAPAGSTVDVPPPPPPGNPGVPARRDRYNVEATDALKAAGMDQLLLQAEAKGSSLLSQGQAGQQAGQQGEKRRGAASEQRIVVVPAAPSSMVNLFNVQELLEKGLYKTMEEAKAAGAKKQDTARLLHEEEGHTYHYRVINNPETLKRDDWARVVAVFVQGPEWQFKKWDLSYFGGKLVGLFSRVCGFHLVYAKEPIHENIPKWNVNILTINRNQRHLDSQVKNKFWECLEDNNRLGSQAKGRAQSRA